jgi:hypothetical protein
MSDVRRIMCEPDGVIFLDRENGNHAITTWEYHEKREAKIKLLRQKHEDYLAEIERLRWILRRIIQSTPHSMVADAEAWLLGEKELEER